MKKGLLILVVCSVIALNAGIISVLSPFMSGAVSAINGKASSVVGGYITTLEKLKVKALSNKELYKKRRVLMEELHKQNRTIEVKIKNVDFVNNLNKMLEAKRTLSKKVIHGKQ